MYHTCTEIINQYPHQKILDIGFGNGYVLEKIADTYLNTLLYDIDISEDMVVATKKKFKPKNIQVSVSSV